MTTFLMVFGYWVTTMVAYKPIHKFMCDNFDRDYPESGSIFFSLFWPLVLVIAVVGFLMYGIWIIICVPYHIVHNPGILKVCWSHLKDKFWKKN